MADSNYISIGAAAIARDVFNDALTVKQIYRLAQEPGWPFVRIRGKLSMRPAAGRAEIERREQAALSAPAPEPHNGRRRVRARSGP